MKTIRLIPKTDELAAQGYITYNGMQLPFNTNIEVDEITEKHLKEFANYKMVNVNAMNPQMVMQKLAEKGFPITFDEASAILVRAKNGDVDARLDIFSFEPELHIETVR